MSIYHAKSMNKHIVRFKKKIIWLILLQPRVIYERVRRDRRIHFWKSSISWILNMKLQRTGNSSTNEKHKHNSSLWIFSVLIFLILLEESWEFQNDVFCTLSCIYLLPYLYCRVRRIGSWSPRAREQFFPGGPD